ncbi:MAG TPA: DoxX family protein [Holophaga sp.]|nr:DoxX family protein [Holophaga sp.]
MKKLGMFTEEAYALLRIVSGSLFLFHGAQKIFGVFSPMRPPLLSQLGLGGLIELLGGLLLVLGLRARAAAFLCSGTMAVAYVQFHWKFQGGAQLLPGVNKGEPALLYAFLFLYIACRGAGIWSLDGPDRISRR